MQITKLTLSNFKSFGPGPTTINLMAETYLLGPNGAGKTAVLEALARLFSPLSSQRKIQFSDFHVPIDVVAPNSHPSASELWLEVEIQAPEAGDGVQNPSVPAFFSHLKIDTAEGVPLVRVRLTAELGDDGYIEEKIEFILGKDEVGKPIARLMDRQDRAKIEVHYLPARRDPADHISYTTASLIGRMLRAVNWSDIDKTNMGDLSQQRVDILLSNVAVRGIGDHLSAKWGGLHHGNFYKDPSIGIGQGDLEVLLRQLTVVFTPSHDGSRTDFERLSDGQKSLLYISLVLAWQSICREQITSATPSFNLDQLRPPVHTLIALEEPENSLAPHYLGRIIRQLRAAGNAGGVQSVIATHSPALLRRVGPEQIRFLRLDGKRESKVRSIVLPPGNDEAAKFVREAVMSYPELYFSRLVILVEGASEQIVLPRLLSAFGIVEDDASISVVPLGGRHVNHFWKLLNGLDIPYVTLIDLDFGRNGGGWGRVKYASKQVQAINSDVLSEAEVNSLPSWDGDYGIPHFLDKKDVSKMFAVDWLETTQNVFFSHPLDLDMMMMQAYPKAYQLDAVVMPDPSLIIAVLGAGHVKANVPKLGDDVLALFGNYRKKFKNGSKPAEHLEAMSRLNDDQLRNGTPHVLQRLICRVKSTLAGLPE